MSEEKTESNLPTPEEARNAWLKVKNEGEYPKARRDETKVNSYTNSKKIPISVSDPYQWLEDPDSVETQSWVNEQVKLTTGFLNQCKDREAIHERIKEMINYPRFGCPRKKGKFYYYEHNTGLQNQDCLYYHPRDIFNAEEKTLVLDPNTWSEDGTISLGGTYTSTNGNLLAYGVKRSGSDWNEFFIRDVEAGKNFKEKLEWCKFTSLSWTHDDKGFFYSRYAPPAKFANNNDSSKQNNVSENDTAAKKGTETEKLQNHQLYYHAVGTEQSDDIFLIDAKTCGDLEWMIGPEVSHDGKWLMINISPNCDPVNRLYLVKLENLNLKNKGAHAGLEKTLIKLIDNFESGYDYITNEGNIFYFKTNKQANNYRVISVDITDPNNLQWREIIPEDKRNRLSYALCVNKNLILLNYMEDCKDVLRLVNLEGKEVKNAIEFPAAGTIHYSGDKDYNEGFFSFSSFLYPGTVYHYDYEKHVLKTLFTTKVPGFDSSQFITNQVFYKSKDGTKIPMFIMHSKSLKMDGENPTILYGYGGFDIPLLPQYSSSRLVWLQNFNGIYAIANLRGGGEYGEEWHKAGTKHQKQNVFDDFQCAAEYLIAEKYTSPKKLAIEGGSNGGLLVAACCNQRPDLFGCGVAMVGVLDMLKFHKFTIGYAWCSDYGSADVPEEFDALYAYSPLHNIPSPDSCKNYPAFLATTADHDDRVVPLHSYKFMAELQYRLGDKKRKDTQTNPLLIRIEVKAGHGGSSLTKAIELRRDMYSFLHLILGAQYKPN